MFRSQLLDFSLSLASGLSSFPRPHFASPPQSQSHSFLLLSHSGHRFLSECKRGLLSPAQLHLPLSTPILTACGFSDRSHPANPPPPPAPRLLPILVQRSCQHHLGHKLHATRFYPSTYITAFLEKKGGKGFRDSTYHPSHSFIRSFVQV